MGFRFNNFEDTDINNTLPMIKTYFWTNVVVTAVNICVLLFLIYKFISCPGAYNRKMTKIAIVTRTNVNGESNNRRNELSYIKRPRSLPSCTLILPSLAYCLVAVMHGTIIALQSDLLGFTSADFVRFVCGVSGEMFAIVCFFIQRLMLYIFYVARLHITFADTQIRFAKNIINRAITVMVVVMWPLMAYKHVQCEINSKSTAYLQHSATLGHCVLLRWNCPTWTGVFIAFDCFITLFSLIAFVFGLRKISRQIRPSALREPTYDRLHQVAYRTAFLTGVMLISSLVFLAGAFAVDFPWLVVLSPIDRAVHSVCIMLMFPRFFRSCDSSFETCFIVTIAYCPCCRWHPQSRLINKMEVPYASFDTIIEQASSKHPSIGDFEEVDPEEFRDGFNVVDLDVMYGVPSEFRRGRSASDSATVSFSGHSSCVALDDLQASRSHLSSSRFSSGLDDSRTIRLESQTSMPPRETLHTF